MSDNNESKRKRYSYMQNRELSWLEFNKRVLDQSADPAVPLLDRLSFLSIYWSNLQEFFIIRVGSLTDLSLVKKTIIDSKSGMTPEQQLVAVYKRCHELYPYYEGCYKALRKDLMSEGVVNKSAKSLTDDQASFVADYFDANVMPFLSPQIINARHPFPHLENGALYIVVRLDEEADKEAKKKSKADKSAGGKGKGGKNVGAEGVTLGIIPLPRQCSRIIRLPGPGLQFILLEHVIEMFVQEVFSMYKVKHTNVICVTRNADLDAVEGAEEQGEDYREHIKKILKRRTRLMPVRLETEKELSATVKPVLLERLDLKAPQTFVSKVPLDLGYVYDLAAMLDADKRAQLSAAPFSPQWPASLDPGRSVIEQVGEKEVLLSYPYETMDAFVQLLREAAVDPEVVSIRITLYRLAKQSHLAEALIAAAENGKEVTALFELRARFDESNNIEWSQRFEQAGCRVIYGFRDYKVHSKICCITRQTEGGLQFITQLGTGNYNEKTARLYTDFSFITSDPAIGRDAAVFFRNMTLENVSDEYKHLWVAPLQIKQNIIAGIDEQIANKKAGKPAGLFFKTNSITDKEIIDKIVEASQAGVQCTLMVRGISCIVPGIKGYTENVCVVSIVGRLLEHSRIYLFGPFDGDFKVYLSSADLMTRNMDKRVEIAWPVANPALRDQILGYIGACMADTAKLRDLLPNKKYTDLGFFAKADKENGQVVLFDSQAYLIHEAQRKRLESDEAILSRQGTDVSRVRDVATDELELDRLGEEVSEFERAQEEGRAQDAGAVDGIDAAAVALEALKGAGDEPEEMGAEAVVDGEAAMDAFGEEASEFVDAVEADEAADVGLDEVEQRAGIDEQDERETAAYAADGNAYEGQEAAFGVQEASSNDAALPETQSGLPDISGLYTPEPNPEGKFTVPNMEGEAIEVERVGGPVPDEGEQVDGGTAEEFARVEAFGGIEAADAPGDADASEGSVEAEAGVDEPSTMSEVAASIAEAVATTAGAGPEVSKEHAFDALVAASDQAQTSGEAPDFQADAPTDAAHAAPKVDSKAEPEAKPAKKESWFKRHFG